MKNNTITICLAFSVIVPLAFTASSVRAEQLTNTSQSSFSLVQEGPAVPSVAKPFLVPVDDVCLAVVCPEGAITDENGSCAYYTAEVYDEVAPVVTAPIVNQLDLVGTLDTYQQIAPGASSGPSVGLISNF